MTIERGVGTPRLFATAYSTVGSSIYFALGVVAAFALGLTPLVFLVAGLLFVITTLTYFEGMTLHPERGGSAADLLDPPLVATTARGVVVVPSAG